MAGVIGLDIGTRLIKGVELGGDGAPARSLVIERRETGEALGAGDAGRVARAMSRRGFTGRKLYVGLPEDVVATDILELPPKKSGAPVEMIARGEIERLHSFKPGTFEVALWELPGSARAGAGAKAVAVSCPHEPALAVLGALEDSGLEPVGIGLASACAARTAIEGGTGVLVDIGARTTNLVFLHQGVVLYERSVADAGVAALSLPIERALDLPPGIADEVLRRVTQSPAACPAKLRSQLARARSALVEKVASELSRAVSFVQRLSGGAPLGHAVVVGGGAALVGEPSALGRDEGIEVRALPVQARSGLHDPTLLCSAIGLAKEGVSV